jgi:hypothetical protein
MGLNKTGLLRRHSLDDYERRDVEPFNYRKGRRRMDLVKSGVFPVSEEKACAVEEDVGKVGNAWKLLKCGSLTAAFVGRQSYSSTNRLRYKLTQIRFV